MHGQGAPTVDVDDYWRLPDEVKMHSSLFRGEVDPAVYLARVKDLPGEAEARHEKG